MTYKKQLARKLIDLACERFRGNHELALRLAEQAQSLVEEFAPVFVARGYRLLESRRFGEAIASLRHALTLDHNHAYAHFYCGLAFFRQRRNNEAIIEFDRAICIKTEEAFVNHRGYSLMELGLLEDAITDFEYCVLVNPSSGKCHAQLGAAFARKGAFETALKLFEKAIDVGPDNGWWHNWKSSILIHLQRYEEAIQAIDEELSCCSESPVECLSDAWTYRGTGWLFLEQYNNALIDLSRALDLNDRNDLASFNFRVALRKLAG